MILSDVSIIDAIAAKKVEITPFNTAQLNVNSYNLRLGNKLWVYDEIVLDPKVPMRHKWITIPENGLVLWPSNLYLGYTEEYTVTRGYVPMVEGRSSIGRLGISIHATAGFGDVGFEGRWTLEISCVKPVKIYPGMEVCQIFYTELSSQPLAFYKGRYQGADTAEGAKLHEEVDNNAPLYDKYIADKGYII